MAVVLLLNPFEFVVGDGRAVIRDVPRQLRPDAEAQVARHHQRPDDAKYGEGILDAVHFDHLVDDSPEELVVSRVYLPLLPLAGHRSTATASTFKKVVRGR